jgi:hypothetical protein
MSDVLSRRRRRFATLRRRVAATLAVVFGLAFGAVASGPMETAGDSASTGVVATTTTTSSSATSSSSFSTAERPTTSQS